MSLSIARYHTSSKLILQQLSRLAMPSTIDAMTEFTKAYAALNKAQREAVDIIDGPVLVVAGPGTGKTQLLGMRAANIVRQTDTAPENILCITFTESAAAAMRQRLINLMGPEGNKVTVHTFHSFGADIIANNSEYFYNGARFSPADDITSYEILRAIFESLPHSSPLAKTMNGEFTALKDARAAISHLKRAGLLPDELLVVLDHNQTFCDAAEPLLTEVFANRFSKKDLPKFGDVAKKLAALPAEPLALTFIKPLRDLCVQEFAASLQQAAETGKTTPLTAWRNKWLEKDHRANFIFKDRKRTKKLRSLATIYQKYRQTLLEQALFDFDDMVSLVAHTLETTNELRYNAQERYQYIMVDEFQDTNGAQSRLLLALTDNPANNGRPNILAVGDDDQAVYAFQGAELSNILDFAARYKDTKIITLTDNYRSTQPILEHARQVIKQGTNRLENSLQHIRKDLIAHNSTTPTGTELYVAKNLDAEQHWIAQQIKERIAKGAAPNNIAVLARTHRQLIGLLPHLHAAGIAVQYERRSNVLESPHITELVTLVELMVALGEQRFDVAESLLPEILSYDFWQIPTADLWKLSVRAYQERRMWLELMVSTPGQLRKIAEFLIVVSHHAMHESLDTILDILLGSSELQLPDNDSDADTPFAAAPPPHDEYTSPYREFYFTKEQLAKNPAHYITLLSNLRAVRRAVAAYRPRAAISVRDFLDYIELCERTSTPVVDTSLTYDALQGVHLMTAHKAKGLEFDTVYVLSCQDDVWGRKTRRSYSSLSFPYNLPIEPAGQHYDDALRLFFVAMTRAKQHLILTAHTNDTTGKDAIVAEFLQEGITPHSIKTNAPQLEELMPGWEQRHLTLSTVTQKDVLRPVLENYQLSATHLNNFLDVTRGGPQLFLLQNLLRFPQSMTPSQAMGQAVHAALARAHNHLAATGERRPLEDVLHDYDEHLQTARLSERDHSFIAEKGSDALHAFLSARYESFTPNQKAERGFSTQGVRIADVRLTGAIDLLEINKTDKTLIVTDYKTGKPATNWRGTTEYDRIKLHKYKQQLMLYKLLAENSVDFGGFTVIKGVLEFIEPDDNRQIHALQMGFDTAELAAFITLLKAVWRHIMNLDLPDTSKYEPTFAGMLAFEDDLRSGKI